MPSVTTRKEAMVKWLMQSKKSPGLSLQLANTRLPQIETQRDSLIHTPSQLATPHLNNKSTPSTEEGLTPFHTHVVRWTQEG
jgi:hypothetical protein